MQNTHASCHYVVTTTPTYCSAVIDLSRSRSVHAVEHNPCCPDPTILSASDCKAVHYGLCSPLLKLPSFSIPQVSGSSPNSPTTPKGASPILNHPKDVDSSSKSVSSSASNSPRAQSSNAIGQLSPTSPKTPSPFHPLAPVNNGRPSSSVAQSGAQTASKVDLEIFDPVELLAVDLEGQLEALVNTFVAQDKVRLAARKKTEPSAVAITSPNARNNSLKKSNNDLDLKSDSSSCESELKYPSNQLLLVHNTHPHENLPVYKDAIAMFSDDSGTSPFYGQSKLLLDFQKSKAQASSTLSPLKPSPEYQQTGVKAQITKFASKEKESASPVNSLERRSTKPKTPDLSTSPSFKPSPLSLDELQELLKSTDSPPEPIQTKVFQSSRISNIPYDEILPTDPPLYSRKSVSPIDRQPQIPAVEPISLPSLVYQNSNILKQQQQQQFSPLDQDQTYRVNPSQEFVQSPVDYAKSRFQQVGNGKSDDPIRPKPKNGHLVTEARFKWENQNWPIQESMTGILVNSNLTADGPSPSIPHPKLTNVQKQHIKERSLSPTDRHSHVPIRPFLTKGSVAERVLLFECCPDRALERTNSGSKNKPLLINTWRTSGSDVQNKTQFWEVVGDLDKSHYLGQKEKDNLESLSPRISSLKRFVSSKSSATKHQQIPRFYYPDGKPASPNEIENHLQRVAAVFSGLTEGKASREEFGIITKACGLPLYWKLPLFLAARGEKRTAITCDVFLEFWRRVVNTCHGEASKFVYVLSKGSRNYLLPEDFLPLMQDVIDSHPGLTFLKEATEFHSRYVHTVIARIYYCVNRSWSGRIGGTELRKSNFLQVLSTLEEEEDINQITEYFSYEHFYVIYCKFWELDKDHDLYIDQNDLKHHNGGALSAKIIERIFSGAVSRGPIQKECKMSYTEFVWFLISEEDKRHPRSIEYWFRCMDLDGDGFLSMYELEYFYQEQLQRLEALGIETLPFNDCLCQMLDIIKPKVPGKIALSDLKKCKMTPIFFDTFFNLEKYLDHEQRDPFASQREHDGEGPEMSDWDRYAADEYELLVAEEGAAEQQDDLICQGKDLQLDLLSPNLDKIMSCDSALDKGKGDDEEFDYAESDIDYHF